MWIGLSPCQPSGNILTHRGVDDVISAGWKQTSMAKGVLEGIASFGPLCFNVGVQIGQIVFVLGVLVALQIVAMGRIVAHTNLRVEGFSEKTQSEKQNADLWAGRSEPCR